MTKSGADRVVDTVWDLARILLVCIVLWIALGLYVQIKHEKPDVSLGGSTAGSTIPAE